ncbi:MAG: hypothetical protein EBS84_20925 [Proteobacteria bacterium]|nr:hypothetical protein [Verrucomicrobiota bacterium]NBU11440.1 hypothetical protein [Pseudomonadota bacterium]
MAERKLSLVILGKATGALAAMKSVGDEAGGLGKKITDLLPSFKTVALAGAAAFGAVTTAAFGAAKAAAEDELSQKKLADQLRRTTGATDEQIAAVEQNISKQMMLTGVTDDELRPAMANLVRATGDVGFAQKQLSLALDISAATGKDLESVSLALGKAFTGNVGALTKLGVPLDASVVRSKNLSEVVATLNTQFGGAAADAADTFSGRLKILQVSLGEAVEGIGYALLPFLERAVAFIQANVVPVIQAFSDTLAGGGGLREAFVNAAAQGGQFGLKVINMVESVTKAFVEFSNIMITLARPLVYVLGAIASALVLIFTRSMSAYKETATTFKNVYDQMGTLQVSTDSVAVAFQNFRNDVLGVAAASTVTQEQLRALEQQARQTAAGTQNVVQPFIGPLLQGYGASATAAKSATDLNAQFAKTLADLQSKAGGAGGAVKKAADAAKTYGDAVVKARDATRSQTDAAKQVQKAQGDVAAKTKAAADAQARFDTVVRGFPSNAKESIDANRRLADAQRGVRDAGLQVADAVRGVQEAEKRLADLRAQKADAEKVGGAERALERSKYGVEEANFRVADAERELAKLRLDPESSATEIRRAEIALLEAKLGVSDAIQAVTDAERRLNDERDAAATPDEIAEAERNLERAKYAVTDALNAQIQATDEQSAAQQNLNEITYGAVVGSAIYNAALKELEDAKAAQVEASDSLADALRREADAMRDLVEAQKALLAVQGATKQGVVNRVQAGLGVTVGAAGSIVEQVAAVSAATGSAPVAGSGVTLNVTAPMFTNPVEIGTEIVDALEAYLRSNGSLPFAV